MTIAEVYGFKENPFEPTGAAVGKYPFVPPANFPVLEQKIEEAGIEKKLYALLVNSPHGAGKSTTMEYLKRKAVNGGYLSFRAPVILTRLSSLSIQDFAEDIFEEARKYRSVKPLPRSKYGLSPSRLRKALVSALSPIAIKNKLLLWIVDEFDILADRPKEEQQMFLQFLRGVIDDFAHQDIPIAFIMSHTKYSSHEFERHLSQTHEPFRSRLVASLPLAYSFDEVKNIVAKRLNIASLSPRQEGDLSPFPEESLRSLYDLIISVRGTDSLDNFRVFERVCHFALIEGAKRGLKEIDTGLVQELFKQYGLKEASVRETRRFSMKTTQEIAAIKPKSLMERNEVILQGLVEGISKSALFKGVSLGNVQTSYMGQVSDTNVDVSSLTFDLTREGKSTSIFWVVATSKAGIIQENDIKDIIQTTSSQLKEHEVYSHIQLLSYVSSVEVLKIPANLFERVLWFSEGLAEGLIGLSVGADEDSDTLIKLFDSDIAPLLSQLVARETRDITRSLSKPTFEVIRTLFVISATGQSCTKEAIRLFNKRLFMRKSKIQERYIKEAIQSGFAEEEAGQIKPSVPKAHIFLLDLIDEGPQEYQELVGKLGGAGEAIIESALAFGLIEKDGNSIAKHRLAEYESEVSPTIKFLRKAHEDETIKQSELGKWIQWLLNAVEYAKKSDNIHSRYVILSAVQELGPQIEKELERYLAAPTHVVITKPAELEVRPSKIAEAQVRPVVVKPRPVPSESTGTIEDAVLQAVQAFGALSIQEISSQMKQAGYEEDIKRTVFRLILDGKLKVVSAE